MSRPSIAGLGSLQREVMEVLWERGEATVQEVREALERARPAAYTTVLSVLQKLERSGWVGHRRAGRSYVYRPVRSRVAEGVSAVRQLLDSVFAGDPGELMQHLLQDEQLDDEELLALRRMIDRRRRQRAQREGSP